jgi:uncharacterized membrane protein YdjX (TVP38/TMEM64 family)
MRTHIVHAVTHWPWSTIAAFTAAAVAFWVARMQTRERQQLLGRQAVVEVNAAALNYSSEGARFLGCGAR